MLSDLTVHFSRPMLLISAALAALPWLIAWRARRRGRWTPWRSAVMQSLALLSLAAALAGPELPLGTTRLRPVDVMVDASASQTGLPEVLAADLPRELSREDFIFADTIAKPGQQVDGQRTNIAPVLSLLTSRAAELSAAVVVTDGQFTGAQAVRPAAQALAATGLPVFLVPRSPQRADARVADLSVRPVGEGGQVELTATVVASAPIQTNLRITCNGRDEPVGRAVLQLIADQPQTVRWTDRPPSGGRSIYRAELVGDDGAGRMSADLLPANNVMAALGPAEPGQTILWAADWPLPAGVAGTAMSVTVADPSALPGTAEELLCYSAVLVCDSTGEVLSERQRAALGEYVRLGGGLVFAGAGPHAEPADRDDPLNRVLPLVASPYERKALDVTVLLDASGSMADAPATIAAAGAYAPKFQIARQAALVMARRQLVPGDRLTVYTFSTSPRQLYAGPASTQGIDELERSLAGAPVGGGTKIVPALEAALGDAPQGGRERLFIILSDLQTEDFDPAAWASRLADAGISLAVVATGRPDGLGEKAPLKLLAERLGAPFIHRDDLGGLAEVFIRFLRQARGDVLIRRPTQVRVEGPLFDTPLSALPDVDDWVATVAQERVEILASTVDGQPLIARWRAGAGRSVCLALPLEGAYNPRWRASAEVGSLMASAAKWVAAPPGDVRFSAQVQRGDGRARLTVAADDSGQPMNLLKLEADVQTEYEDRRRQTAAEGVPIPQTAPGVYQADLPAWGASPTVVQVRLTSDGSPGPQTQGRVVWRQAFAGRYPDELARLGVNEPALRELAELCGGRIVAADQLPARIRGLRQLQARALWPYLLGLALALALIDWVTTRLVRR